MTDEAWFEEFCAALDGANVRVQFWQCPTVEHRGEPGDLRQTVEWRGDVAYCMTPGCGRNSAEAKR